MNWTHQLAHFAAHTPAQDIPDAAWEAASAAFIDTVGVALAGCREPVCEIALSWVEAQGCRPQASVLGRGVATSPAEAAFANGIAAHALDFDDSLLTLRGHPSAPLVSAALAVGQSLSASGEAMLAAYIVGVEMAGKLGAALGDKHYMHGWHTTATVGTLSAATAAARLHGLDAQGMQLAWGIAATQMAGLRRNFGSMVKPMHAGQAARAGVQAAWLASRGFSASTDIFDGPGGVLQVYGLDAQATLAQPVSRLGQPWEILQPGISVKRWPCCYVTHRPIAGLQTLQAQHGLRTDEVERVDVTFIEGIDAALINERPKTGLEGKFSIEYVVAAQLLDGGIGLASFTDDMIRRPEIQALMDKVHRHVTPPASDSPDAPLTARLALETTRGPMALQIDHAPGSRQAPMSADDRRKKFMDCAQRVLSQEEASHLLSLLTRCRQLSDVNEILRAAH